MSRIYVAGYGAVSPAGWSAGEMLQALAVGTPVPIQPLDRPGWAQPFRTRPVPPPATRPAFLSHPRLRRTSPITHYAAAALLEALAPVRPPVVHPVHPVHPVLSPRRIGLIVCMQSGCVQYTHRFFAEALADPATASPLLFPETVFAAPASHLAALVENTPLVSTLLGDPATFGQGLALGAAWLQQDRVDIAVVVGAEEINWVRASALWSLERAAVISGGAGAVALSCDPKFSSGVELLQVTRAHSYSACHSRLQAVAAVRTELAPRANELLCDSQGHSPRADGPESAVWQDWRGPRLSPKIILGEGQMAAAAWQCVAACATVAGQKHASAITSLAGCNQQAVGVRFGI